VTEAAHLVALAREAGARTAVGLQARNTPTVRHLRHLVADGYVGTVLSTTILGTGGGWGATTTSGSAYTLDRAHGATLLTVPFGHTLDAVRFVLGDLTEITATTAVRRAEVLVEDTGERVTVTAPDQVAVTARLDGGAVLAAHFRGGNNAGTGLRWEINGTDGDVVLTGPNGHLQFGQAVLAGSRHGAALDVLEVPGAGEPATAGLVAQLAPSRTPTTSCNGISPAVPD
jgi:predicted dehydrogenase